MILLGLCLAACRRTEPEIRDEGLPADLSISISLPRVETKAGYDDGKVSPTDAAGSGWTDWDRLVDGQSIYRLTLFLVRLSDNHLVGFRDFYKNSSDWCDNTDADPAKHYGLNGFCASDGTLLPKNTEFATCARAYFSYLTPMYGAHEKLGSGNYRIYAVANYSPISGVANGDDGLGGTATKDYTGLPDDGNGTALTSIISGIKTAYVASIDGLANFNTTGYPSFFNYKVKSETVSSVDQFVCAQRPQPLTFMTDFLVLSGTNSIEAELVRTYSRIRFVVNNESETETMTLNSFSFLSPFAQNQAFLFDPGDDSKYNSSWTGIPVLNSTHAIHSYPGDGTTVSPDRSAVIFDAYILESKRGTDKYTYRLDVQYSSTSSSAVNIYNGQPIRSLSSLQTALNNAFTKYLIIENGRGHGFLFDDGSDNVNYEANNASRKYLNSTVTVNSDLTLTPVSPNTFVSIDLSNASFKKFVWTIQKINESLTDWNLYISNFESGKYWDKNIVNATSPTLKTTSVNYRSYCAEEYSGGPGLAFRNMGFSGSDPCYLHKDRYGTKTKNGQSVFALYALDDGVPARAEKDIVLQVIDPVSHQPYDLEEFCRNDFITVNIGVSVHPDGGWLEFIVNPWTPVNGTVTFN